MKYEQFDWEKYQAGAKVFTRNGDEVTQLVKFEEVKDYCLIGVSEGEVQSWTYKGNFRTDGFSSGLDLVLDIKEKKRYLIINQNSGYETLDDALNMLGGIGTAIVEITHNEDITTKIVWKK